MLHGSSFSDIMRILITGSSGGIGKYLYKHFSQKGCDVTGISSKDVDITDWDQTNRYFREMVSEDFNLVIHCAAKNATIRFERMSLTCFREIIDCNIIGTFNLLRNVLPRVKKGGSIILFSSLAAFSPRIGQSAYAASKAALHGLIKCLAIELLVDNKYIFLIAPGLTEVGMPQKMMTENMLSTAQEKIPMRRFCTKEEIVNTIEYLRQTPYLTGQTIHLNGGYAIV